jgi:hypothetical protein
MPGYGILRLDKEERTITVECWPRHADPADPAHAQYPGWPRTIAQKDNYGRRAVAYLPELRVTGMTDPVVQVIDEGAGEVVYTLRIRGTRYRPGVFSAGGTYTVRVGELGIAAERTLRGLTARPAGEAQEPIEVVF